MTIRCPNCERTIKVITPVISGDEGRTETKCEHCEAWVHVHIEVSTEPFSK